MIQSLLKDQLPGAKYFSLTDTVLEETKNCQRTNVISERDFAQYDRKLKAKPHITTVAAAGIIMFNNNKTYSLLDNKDEAEFSKIIESSRTNRKKLIQEYSMTLLLDRVITTGTGKSLNEVIDFPIG